ncbi:MAG: hypothetical protein Ct9H300mP20_12370 [Gammaproteobacteria bacterium]|nr:MAG: hypothetical protein Ct9H300mP20_12370 [Gammaproteobacteria bacterium]
MTFTLVFMTTEVKLPTLDGNLVCNLRQTKKGDFIALFFMS